MTLVDEWASAPLVGVVHGGTSPSMDPSVRNLLVAGLRSGMYRQGYDRLRSADDTFTPLGVLCDIATRLKRAAWDRIDNEWFIAPLTVPASGGVLPLSVREWAKIKGTHPSQELPLVWRGNQHPIWRLSDIFKLSFDEIASLIEAQY
jgi:hypothetical protein